MDYALIALIFATGVPSKHQVQGDEISGFFCSRLFECVLYVKRVQQIRWEKYFLKSYVKIYLYDVYIVSF